MKVTNKQTAGATFQNRAHQITGLKNSVDALRIFCYVKLILLFAIPRLYCLGYALLIKLSDSRFSVAKVRPEMVSRTPGYGVTGKLTNRSDFLHTCSFALDMYC